ncbi:MAG: hypothetical protein WCJ14_09200 [Verrucomicrobiota bacterium]
MKSYLCVIAAALCVLPRAAADVVPVYTNYLRQYQTPTGVVWASNDTVAATGTQQSSLAINPGGARFDLWTIKASPYTEYLLDTKYVSTYTPAATVVITSEDPYALEDPDHPSAHPLIPRTRADRPFYVKVTVAGLSVDPAYPPASKSVNLCRYVQSYGVGGTGIGIDRTQATLLSQAAIATTVPQTLTYALTSVPGADRTKVRGEERFSVFTLLDATTTPSTPASQLASQYIQIWPVADGAVTGITQGQVIRNAMPQLTLTLHDLYPYSTTYAQVYKGSPQLGTAGAVVPGSNLVVSDTVPANSVLLVSNYDAVLPTDGVWTIEILTTTPFGTDRLAYLSFTLDRTIEMNGSFTTIE